MFQASEEAPSWSHLTALPQVHGHTRLTREQMLRDPAEVRRAEGLV